MESQTKTEIVNVTDVDLQYSIEHLMFVTITKSLLDACVSFPQITFEQRIT
jgi:hypothetical protein